MQSRDVCFHGVFKCPQVDKPSSLVRCKGLGLCRVENAQDSKVIIGGALGGQLGVRVRTQWLRTGP